jgi:copper transport protein
VLSNGVHVVAAAAWLGGLIGLGLVLWDRTRPEPSDAPGSTGSNAPTASTASGSTATTTAVLTADRPTDVAAVERLEATALIVSRFSDVALVSVIALILAGLTMAWIEVGSVHALTSTTYGRLVLTKIAIVLVIAVFAAYNRFRLVPDIVADTRHARRLLTAAQADGDDAGAGAADTDTDTDTATLTVEGIEDDPVAWAFEGLRRLARTVMAEALAILVVLAVTSVLVNTQPARNVVGDVSVANQTLPITTSTPDSTLNLVVAPATAGTNSVHLSYYDAQGRPIAVAGPVKIEFALPDADIGPITRDVVDAGPGHYILDDADLSPKGTWQITVVTRTSEFEQQRTTFSVKIR